MPPLPSMCKAKCEGKLPNSGRRPGAPFAFADLTDAAFDDNIGRNETLTMDIPAQYEENLLILRPHGRIDAHGSEALAEASRSALKDDARALLLDMRQVNYLSSAGLRVFLALHKTMLARSGAFVLFGLQEYCAQVLDIAGFSDTLAVFKTEREALAHARSTADRDDATARPDGDELRLDGGRLRVVATKQGTGTIDVLGDINDVLHARIEQKHIASKPFFHTEYSLGLGALGDKPDDYLPIMGESIMIGGTMVWLPTDGHDTPDFLIPKKQSASVTLRTGFNVCVRGGFNETVYFEADDRNGISMSALYRALFDLSRTRRPDFRGALGLAMRAEVGQAFGSGVTRSPILSFKPANGEMIVHPDNFPEWFEIDKEPRHRDLTALICGVGVDLTMDLSGYNQTYLNRSFYLNPSNQPAHDVLLHNHAVFFSPQPMPVKATDLEHEIEQVVDQGDFMDMRHLLDQTTVKKALIGINYVQDFREDRRT